MMYLIVRIRKKVPHRTERGSTKKDIFVFLQCHSFQEQPGIEEKLPYDSRENHRTKLANQTY